jgi:large subunit ribosomal protein L24
MSKYEVKCKLKKGDEVIVTKGRAKGSVGKIEAVSRKDLTVLLAGINISKRHVKPDLKNPDGGVIDKAMPIAISNVAIVDPKTKKASRIGYKIEAGKKVRFSKKSGVILA